jgi:hypothetical protein
LIVSFVPLLLPHPSLHLFLGDGLEQDAVGHRVLEQLEVGRIGHLFDVLGGLFVEHVEDATKGLVLFGEEFIDGLFENFPELLFFSHGVGPPL